MTLESGSVHRLRGFVPLPFVCQPFIEASFDGDLYFYVSASILFYSLGHFPAFHGASQLCWTFEKRVCVPVYGKLAMP